MPLLSDYANSHNLHFTASAFDITSLNILEANNVPFHKVASSETTNLKMVHRIANSGKPVVISTGMCDMVDVEEAVNVCLAVGNNKIVLMQCGTMYPLPPGLANLRVIVSFAERFGCPAGFSDHTIGYAAATASIGLGCSMFEKHFTLDRNAEGPDHFYALEPVELKNYIEALHEAHKALGQPTKEMLPQEREFGMREGLYLKRDMNKGEIIAINDIVSRRPSLGLRTRYMPTVLGAELSETVVKD